MSEISEVPGEIKLRYDGRKMSNSLFIEPLSIPTSSYTLKLNRYLPLGSLPRLNIVDDNSSITVSSSNVVWLKLSNVTLLSNVSQQKIFLVLYQIKHTVIIHTIELNLLQSIVIDILII